MVSTKICSVCHIEYPEDFFNKQKNGANGLQAHCKSCDRKRNKKYYKINRIKNIKVAKKNRSLYVQRDQEFVLSYLKEHPCIDCGEADPIVLEFDHVRGKKFKGICDMVSRGFALAKIILEISKCEVRCANCHRRKTAKELEYFKHSK
jgi:hypothetical protein